MFYKYSQKKSLQSYRKEAKFPSLNHRLQAGFKVGSKGSGVLA